jgi:ABC-type polysaccharide/polyol phosphate export permease
MTQIPVYEAENNRLNRSLLEHLRYASRYLAFFLFWTRRSITTRYSQTSVGLLWALLQPMLSSLVYIIVFSLVIRISTDPVPYPLFIFVSIVMWSYFNRIVFSGAAAITSNLDIVTRVQFPREFLILSVWVESMVDLLIGLGIAAILFLLYRYPLPATLPIALFVFVIHTIFSLALAFIISALNSRVRDFMQLLPILLQLLFYLSPVLYPLDLVPESVRGLYFFNPLGSIFAAYQETILFGRFTLLVPLLVIGVFSLVLLVVGYKLFKRMEWNFVDLL